LLDSNLLENEASDQGITDTLYGGDAEMRLRQEMILGIGGYQALIKTGHAPTVCHMNEGHAALLALERIRHAMAEDGVDFRTARQATVGGNVFTTHTPVPAGFDLFEPGLVERYLAKTAAGLGVAPAKLLEMGRLDGASGDPRFNMAALAMSNADAVNGVSRLHAAISREMFSPRWPNSPLEEVPVESVTNGVHTMTWMGRRATELFDQHLGPAWRDDPSDSAVWERASEISDREVWDMRENERGDLVRFCRRRLREQLQRGSSGPVDLAEANDVLDPRVLTIGFARRFATYKRANLVFSDVERLQRILFHPDRPVQFVFSGKSHPKDDGGKRLIQQITEFIRSTDARKHIVFLEDYDMAVARRLIQGVDVWLNNPRRPMEASGTSGMKVVPNGGLNCSILDGWWAEAYAPGLGWAIGDERSSLDEGYQDWLDSRSLYHLIENEIAPTFYYRTDGGLPKAWIEMIKASWRKLAPRFSTLRMVREYTSRFYVPASDGYVGLRRDGYAGAKAVLGWRDAVTKSWAGIQILRVEDDSHRSVQVGTNVMVHATVALGDLRPEDVRVQALHGQVTSSRELSQLEIADLAPVGQKDGAWHFSGEAPCMHPGQRGYVVRVVPHHSLVRVAHELPLAVYEPTV
jgi:starch phosphorylase